MVEMQSLLREALSRFSLAPSESSAEAAFRRGITITPDRQATVVLSRRSPLGSATERAAAPAAA